MEPERAAAGLHEAGFGPGAATANSVQGRMGNASLGAEGGHGGPTRVWYGVPVEDVQGSHADVERTGDAIIARHDADARAAIEAFARGAGWTLDTPIEWYKGTLHGDC